MNLLDLMRDPMIVRPIDPNGSVVQGPADEVYTWRKGWRSVQVELHPYKDGLWMWSVSFSLMDVGSGYKVGAKWGRFANTRDSALYFAVDELVSSIETRASKDEVAAVTSWARGLR